MTFSELLPEFSFIESSTIIIIIIIIIIIKIIVINNFNYYNYNRVFLHNYKLMLRVSTAELLPPLVSKVMNMVNSFFFVFVFVFFFYLLSAQSTSKAVKEVVRILQHSILHIHTAFSCGSRGINHLLCLSPYIPSFFNFILRL